MNTSSKIIIASLVTFGSLLGSGQANADSAQVLTKTISYDAATLNSRQGAKTLYTRLQFAAQEVCSPLENRDLSRRRVYQSCVDTAVESAVLKVNSPLVSAVHNQATLRADAG
jgi:UrcA family protein